MFIVYAIKSSRTGRIYIGQTNDLDARLLEHNKGNVPSTRKECPWHAIKTEGFDTRSQARWHEYQLKSSRGRRLKWLEQ
jgi:putative endonuclease